MSGYEPPATPLANPYGGYGPLIMGVTWAQASLGLILMLLRTYTNAFIIKSFKWDYFWATVTLISSMLIQAMLTVSCAWGMGNHIELLTPPQILMSLKWSWFGQFILIQSIGFGKLAVIAFLLRIQHRAHSWKDTVLVSLLYFIGFSNVIININQLIQLLISCHPAERLWDQSLPGDCSNLVRTNRIGYFQGAWATASDVVLAIYPILVFWNLKISNKIKIGLCFLMAGGLIAAAAGVTKTVYLKLISVSTDITSAESPLLIWAWTENWLVLILGSLPPLRPLFVKAFDKISTTASNSRKKKSGYYPEHSDHRGHNSIPMYPPTIKAPRPMGNDDDSEKNILPGVLPSGNGILKTTHVHVGNTARSDGDSEESVGAMERGQAY